MAASTTPGVECRDRGARPAIIPFGGSNALGARGYVDVGPELLVQAPDMATAVTAVGSGGTMAGLVTASGPERVLGVDCAAVPEPAEIVAGLVAELSGRRPNPQALRLRADQIGAGYSVLSEPVFEAMILAARTEGLLLDPIYTGRALAGLATVVRDGEILRGRRTILLHSGGLPELFGRPAASGRAEALLSGAAASRRSPSDQGWSDPPA